MKKITIAILMLLGSFSMASAELGVKIGASMNIAVFHATGTDTDASSPLTEGLNSATQSEDATGVAGFSSFFIEKDLAFLPGPFSRFSIGYDFVDKALEGDATETRSSLDSASTNTDKTNVVKIAFENMSTTYVTFNITDTLYVKTGSISLDLVTKENLGTGGSFKDESLSGSMGGIGMSHMFDNGMFFRAEGTLIDIDSATAQTSGDHTVDINDISGASARFSIGKAF
tara:strand:- start:924 stop:1610 length:687 start_codon:yes stop_codon:yes gene_type:complete